MTTGRDGSGVSTGQGTPGLQTTPEPEEAGRIPLKVPREHDLDFRQVPQNRERINFCCFKPSGGWDLLNDPRNGYTPFRSHNPSTHLEQKANTWLSLPLLWPGISPFPSSNRCRLIPLDQHCPGDREGGHV